MLHHPSTSDKNASAARTAPVRSFFGLVVAALVILFLGRTNSDTLDNLRVQAAETFSGFFTVFSGPVSSAVSWADGFQNLVLVYRENERLRIENRRLLDWKAHAERLQSRIARYNALLNVQIEAGIDYVTARAVADGGGAFVRTQVINAGRRDGVAKGQAVVNHKGLVGRVVGAGETTARVLLVTDLNSRVPVMIGDQGQRAILTGDNSAQPRLQFLMATGKVEVGDAVMTSGDGGILPPGLPIGVVAGIDQVGDYRVVWYPHDGPIDAVRVLKYSFPANLDAIDGAGVGRDTGAASMGAGSGACDCETHTSARELGASPMAAAALPATPPSATTPRANGLPANGLPATGAPTTGLQAVTPAVPGGQGASDAPQ